MIKKTQGKANYKKFKPRTVRVAQPPQLPVWLATRSATADDDLTRTTNFSA